jgi:hypothetical protein
LVGKYDFTQTPNPITLWTNPSPSFLGQMEPTSGAITIGTGPDTNSAGSIYGIDRFNFRQNALTGGSSVPGFMQWDELRIGTSWAQVTPSAPARFSSIHLLPDSRVHFQVTVGAGSVTVERSSNLVNWAGWTNLISTNGTYEFFDSVTNEAQRFYRLRTP